MYRTSTGTVSMPGAGEGRSRSLVWAGVQFSDEQLKREDHDERKVAA